MTAIFEKGIKSLKRYREQQLRSSTRGFHTFDIFFDIPGAALCAFCFLVWPYETRDHASTFEEYCWVSRCRLPWAFVGFAFVDKAIGRCRSSLLREQKVFHFCCNRRFMETGALTILRNIADPTHLSFAFSQQLCIFQLSLDVDQCQQNAKFAELEPGKWRSLFREVHRRCVFVSTLVRVVQSCTCKQWFFVFSRSGWKIWRFPQCACQWHGEPW